MSAEFGHDMDGCEEYTGEPCRCEPPRDAKEMKAACLLILQESADMHGDARDKAYAAGHVPVLRKTLFGGEVDTGDTVPKLGHIARHHINKRAELLKAIQKIRAIKTPGQPDA